MIKRLTIFTLCFVLLSCGDDIETDPETGFEIFTIEAGTHTSIRRSEDFEGSRLNVTAMFDESAQYTLENTNDQADINKLIGFSDCQQHHQTESARIGWRWYEDELQILAYAYVDGQLIFEKMGAIALNQEVTMSIEVLDTQYRFSGQGLETITLNRNGTCQAGTNYWLWPYFGGNQVAPHEITIRLKREAL